MPTDKRVKVAVGARVHPIKKEKLQQYAKDNNTTVQILIEDYIDQLLNLSEDEIKTYRDARVKKDLK